MILLQKELTVSILLSIWRWIGCVGIALSCSHDLAACTTIQGFEITAPLVCTRTITCIFRREKAHEIINIGYLYFVPPVERHGEFSCTG